MKQWPSVITAVAFASAPASAGVPPFATQPISDSELAATTGGFSTPVGIDVNFAVEINTRIDGQLALRSVLKPGIEPVTVHVPPVAPPMIDVPPVVVAPVDIPPVAVPPVHVAPVDVTPVNVSPVSVPPVTVPPVTVPPITVGTAPVPANPTITPPILDATFNPPAVQQALPAINVAIGAIGSAAGAAGAAVGGAAGTEHVVVPTTAPIESAFGKVTVEPSRTGPQVLLAGPDIEVRHMLGQATTVIANVANDRVIDTTTIVHLDLPNVQGFALGSVLSRIDDAIRRD